jgi:hypothetical protein
MTENEIINWISIWFKSNCNGDWEHENLITITTTDNPGWLINIDLTDIELNFNSEIIKKVDISDDDWYFFKIKDEKFVAGGDITKLYFLLNSFKSIIQEYSK